MKTLCFVFLLHSLFTTGPGLAAEGLPMNVRMVNAIFEDRSKPDFDPEANADRFIAQIPDCAAHGVNAFTLCLQGGMPGLVQLVKETAPGLLVTASGHGDGKVHAEVTPSQSSMEWTVGSPNGAIRATVMLDESHGTGSYRVSSRGVTVIEQSPLGITTSVGDFTRGLVFASNAVQEINETYVLPVGKRSTYVNHANELVLTLRKGQDWFIGGMTDPPRTARVALGFLAWTWGSTWNSIPRRTTSQPNVPTGNKPVDMMMHVFFKLPSPTDNL